MALASATRRAMPPDGMQLGKNDMANQSRAQLRVLTQWKRDVFKHAEVGQQRPVLEQHPEALAHLVELVLVQGRDVDAVDLDDALLRNQLPRYQSQQRRLAGAARPHNRRDLAFFQVQVEAIEHSPRATRELEAAYLDQVVVRVTQGMQSGPSVASQDSKSM